MIGLAGLIFPIVIIVVGVLIYIEKKLAAKENIVYGLVPILIVALIGAGLTAVCYHTVSGYSTKTLTETLKSGNEAQVTVKYDRSGRVLCNTGIVIKSPKGDILDRIEIYSDEGEAHPYKSLIEKFGISDGCVDEESIKENYVVLGKCSIINPIAPLILMFMIEIPFLIIYIYNRVHLKKKRRYEESRRLKIEQM